MKKIAHILLTALIICLFTESTYSINPIVDFTWENTCLSEQTQFTVDSIVTVIDSVQTWTWDFGDGSYSNLQNPSHQYNAAGTYNITLSIITIDNSNASVTHSVDINPLPTANFSHTGPACLNDSVFFANLSSSPNGNIETWHWDFGDGDEVTITAPNDPNVSHIYANAGTFVVTLTVTDNTGCRNTISMPLQVFDVPRPGFSFEQECNPMGWVNFTNETQPGSNNSPIIAYEWLLEYNNYSTDVNPAYIYQYTDTCYTVVLTATNVNGCSASDTNTQVCLFGRLETSFEADTVCLGQPTMFQASYAPQSDSVASYLWNFNDESPKELTYHDTISHVFPNPGMYMVELTAVDTNGCSATYMSQVYIDSIPTASFTNTIGGCDIPTYFEGIDYSGGEFIESWWWDFGDTTSLDNTATGQKPSHLYGPNDSIYQVKLIVMNYNGCYDSIVQEVYVAPCINAGFILPQDSIFAGNEICFIDTSLLAINNIFIKEWFWDFGDGITEVYNNFHDSIYHEYENEGIYQVELTKTASTDTIILTSTSVEELTVYPPSGIYENSIGNIDFSIIPNPSNGIFTISSDEFIGNTAVVSIISADGSIVYQNSYRVTNNKLNININGESFASGIYTVMIKSEEYSGVSKLIIRN